MTGRTHVIPPRLHLENNQVELQRALSTAQHLRQRRRPDSLNYEKDGPANFEQAKRTVLMERMVLAKFDCNDLYFGTYRSLFDAYPHPLDDVYGMKLRPSVDLENPAVVKEIISKPSLKIYALESPRFEHETFRDMHPLTKEDPLDRSMVVAATHTLIEFVFRWCLNLADEIEEKIRGGEESPAIFTLLKEIEPFRYRLSYHAEYLDPLQYFAVEATIINPHTGFPFNVPHTCFPHTLQ